MEQGNIKQPEAGIMQLQNSSGNRQITPIENEIGKTLLHINQLIAYPKDGPELQDWAISINNLMPGLDTAHLKFVIDLMKLDIISFDKNEGVQNIFKAVKQTKNLFGSLTIENNFRKRRAAFVQYSMCKSYIGKTLTQYVNRKYFRLLENAYIHYFNKGNEIWENLKKKDRKDPFSIPRHKLEEIHNYCPQLNAQESLQLYSHIYFTYRHPIFKAAETDCYLYSNSVAFNYPNPSLINFSIPNEVNPIDAFLKNASAKDLFLMGY